ncbi:hypothetical protein J7F02_20775, partial [Streptomyces sp. ISL-112]|uniref:hypothetical protein n=1 Tax=Streptomyces sp. ISL-112 TaxID=2819176 RepID=UPI001BE92BA7
ASLEKAHCIAAEQTPFSFSPGTGGFAPFDGPSYGAPMDSLWIRCDQGVTVTDEFMSDMCSCEG